MDGRGRPESARGCIDVEEFRKVQGGEVMEDFKGEEQNLVVYPVLDREPMELLKDRSDVVNEGGFGDDASGRVLDQLKFMDRLVRETKKKGVTVVYTGYNQGVNKNGGAVGGEGRAEAMYVA